MLNNNFSSIEAADYLLYSIGLYSVENNIILDEQSSSNYSFTISDMLLNCRFNNIECTTEDFVYYRSFLKGNCYKFNSGRIQIIELSWTYYNFLTTGFNLFKLGQNQNRTETPITKSSTPGRLNGLKIELYVGQLNEYNQVVRSTGIDVIFWHTIYSIYAPISVF